MAEPGPPDHLFTVGKVLGPWGRAGLVRVYPLTDFPERLPDKREVRLWRSDTGTRPFRIRDGKLHHGHVLLGFEGVDTMSAAEVLKGCLVMVEEEGLEPLPEGAYYRHRIVGLEAVDGEGRRLGDIRDIVSTGGADVWVVGDGEREILVPAARDIVTVDLASGRVIVRMPPEEKAEKP